MALEKSFKSTSILAFRSDTFVYSKEGPKNPLDNPLDQRGDICDLEAKQVWYCLYDRG